MTAGNDVVDLSNWNGSGSVNIGDAFSNDNDKVTVMADDLAAGANLKLTSIENLEIVNSDERNPVILKGANFKGLEVVKLIGDATTLDVSSFTQGVKIDATANADTITGSDKADTINGGAGNDIITGNDGNDVLTGGNGADEFVVGTVKAAGIDQILDFSAEDKITMKGFSAQELKKFDASTFSTVTYKTLDSVLATFRSGGANVTKDGDVVIFSYDGKTYALLANGAFTEAGSALVDITGANVASLTESNFGATQSITPTPGGDYNYENYAAFAADVALGVGVTNATIQTMTVAEAATLNTTGSGNLSKIAAGGIKAITGNVIDVDLSSSSGSHTVNAAAFDDKLDPSIIAAGTVTMNITGSGSADTLAASVLGGTIKGNGGIDTIKLNSGKDVVDFSTTTAADNANNVIGFDVAKDKLQFDATTFTSLNSVGNVKIVTVDTATDAAQKNKEIVVDTAAKIATLKLTTANDARIAIATDTGNIIYDADSNFSADSVVIGNIGSAAAANLTADNFVVVA